MPECCVHVSLSGLSPESLFEVQSHRYHVCYSHIFLSCAYTTPIVAERVTCASGSALPLFVSVIGWPHN